MANKFVPPHLRGSSAGPPPASPGGGGGYGGFSGGGGGGGGGTPSRGGFGGGGYGDDRRGPGGSGAGGGTSHASSRDGGGGGSSGGGGAYGAPRDGGGAGAGAAAAGAPRAAAAAPAPAPSAASAPPGGAPWAPPAHVTALTADQVDEIRRRLDVQTDVPAGEPPAPCPLESFDDMGLDKVIMLDIKYHGYERPTPIQAAAMPLCLTGRDILGCAETGSGKTAAFSIPMIHFCLRQPSVRRGDGPLALVMAPTRELAQQIEKEVKAFSRSARGFKTAIVVGGAPMGDQRADLRAGVDVVVATPGRFIDHLQSGNTSLGRVGFVVLDEADRMLDMGFEPQIREVMHSLPPRHQTLLFSATMPAEVEALAQDYLSKPVKVKVGAVSTPTANVAQHIEKVPDAGKLDRLCELMLEEQAEAAKMGRPLGMTVVFVERKARADDVAELLSAEGVPAVALHGGRSQGEREAALRDFSTGKVPVLVATDVASRGLDVKGIAHVINMDLPKAFEDYVHRIGRTGRAGATGRATSFYTDRDAYVVATIKTALQEAERGHAVTFATGKEARRRERDAAEAFRATGGVDPAGGGGGAGGGGAAALGAGLGCVQLDDRLKHQAGMMKAAAAAKAGGGSGAAGKPGAAAVAAPNADAAWDD